ncbi:juvenile hormone esterase-like isoform X1 [Microplitis mediator]|uniref:juvenile hormone esterase-like isoform X1 n=1 Tax=Microplitis mediator TaxID=375433 RepID=UPI0025562E98|nr:juvenile hormone esterase-like isoform X1 [Microplitis mediator]
MKLSVLLLIIQITILLNCIQLLVCTENYSTEVVKTDKGFVQGKVLNTAGKTVRYSTFLGIPYAKPPIGYRRFKPPEEADAWTGIYQATKEKEKCPQRNPIDGFPMGKEDCLYLNVYSPKVDSNDTQLRPVMVWIYGGGFDSGSNSPDTYGPDFLIEEDVVVVAMNYRLGALGFLSLNHTNATGNAGLKDQNLALKWVQKNIRNFGGDPKKITIFGQSAGSASTLYHILSDQSKGLFRSAIAMSGSPLNRWGFTDLPEAVSRSFAIGKQMGIITTNASFLLQKLYNATADHIVLATTSLATKSPEPYMTPTIENPKIATAPILTECSISKLKTGNFNHVPIILGFVNIETLLYVGTNVVSREGIIDATIKSVMKFPELLRTEEIKYLINLKNSSGNNFNLPIGDQYQISWTSSDILFNYGIDRTQRFLAAAKSTPVYYYRNSFDYNQSLHRIWGVNLDGTSHADDVAQVFWLPKNNQSLDPQSDIGIQRSKTVRMWTNFAKYSNPTPNGTSDPLLKITWPPSSPNGICLEINRHAVVGPRPINKFLDYVEKVMEPSLNEENGC